MIIRKNHEIALFIVGCILINYIGKIFSDVFTLPLWLDSIGTVFAAYVFGPVCGAVVGAAVNIIYGFHVWTSAFYALTNIAVGVTVGICAKKGFLNNVFGMLSTAFAVALISVVISTPLNYILSEGYTGNVWGDGMIGLLQEMGWNEIFNHIAGEFYLDFLDKVVTMLLLFWAVRIVRSRKKGRKKKQKMNKALLGVLLVLLSTFTVQAKEAVEEEEIDCYDFNKYVQTIFNGQNGLTGGIASDIVQTKDGVLWIGTHGGLYRYTGNTFQWMKDLESVKTVNCLYTDEAGRLWIGTNDNGLSICINQQISNVVNRENGLPSNSVHCITENTEGYYYVGTADSLVVMTLSSGLRVCDTIPEIVSANSICADQNGNVAAVTEKGTLFFIQGTEIMTQQSPQKDGDIYTCCAFDEAGKLYVGTSGNTVESYYVLDGQLKKMPSIKCGELKEIHSLRFSEEKTMFICAENGAGYVNTKNQFSPIELNHFNSAIEHMLVDYQGNLWFTSLRNGLLRLCPSVFSEVYVDNELPENIVNTVTMWNGCLYMGTDSGMKTLTEQNSTLPANTLPEMLQGVQIHCLMTDSQNHMWICTSDKGIWEVSKDGQINQYDSKKGAFGDSFYSVIEITDGAIAAAGDFGVTMIQNAHVQNTVRFSDGGRSLKVLSLCERTDGSIWAGTDGGGIVILEDGKIAGTLKQEDGLSSEVILRMVPDSDGSGLFLVTGNGLCYTNNGNDIRSLDQFPYYNNYDLVESHQGELFVLSSAGIYVVDKAELLEGGEVTYELLDYQKGLQINLTPNAWNYRDEKDNLYLSGDTGVVSLNLNQYGTATRSYRMLLTQIRVDGEIYPVEKGEATSIPRGAGRIEFTPEIINYSIHNPTVSVYLEGFDKEPKIMPQSEMASVVYTNLPTGAYTFRLAVLDGRTGSVIAENTYRIVKEKEIYDNWWFLLYAGVVTAMIISYLTWLIVRTQIQKTLRMQKLELEWAKNQLQMGNETILTIAQAVDAKDERTNQHSLRVSEYSVIIAKKLGYSDEACEELRKIAMLHDIGKIGIPDMVLNKPARLTDEEYEIMKSHVTRGAEILKNFTLIDHVADGALYHHERYDGSGYVHGLKGEEIPLNARIIGIADAFDAMTENRVYRKKLDLDYVLKELRNGRGTQFDPKLVDIMLDLIADGTIDVNRIYKNKG